MGDSVNILRELPLYITRRGRPAHQFHFKLTMDENKYIITYSDELDKILISANNPDLEVLVDHLSRTLWARFDTQYYVFYYGEKT